MENRTITDFSFGDESVLSWTRQAILDVADSNSLGLGGGGLEFDSVRIAKTIEYITAFRLSEGRVIEVGSLEYLASQIIWRYFPDAKPTGTSNDLRIEPMDFPDNYADALICLEVIEHLSDVPYGQATTLRSVLYFLEDVYRVLKVGGKALFTTPNAASLWTIQQALLHNVPMMYPWHFREFTVSEFRQVIESVGFQVVSLSTEYVWHHWDFEPIRQFMASQGYSLDDRGDDIFLVVSKPFKRVRKAHNLRLPL